MAKLIIMGRDGAEKEIEGKTGLSVMENIREAGFDDLLALCGGCCSCATCHVYVESPDVAVPARSEDEQDLLEGSSHMQDSSRLSCQLVFTAAMDGLKVRIAPED
jgi:ferredoxin, 2Fe-2S